MAPLPLVYPLTPNGAIPNHPSWPVLLYCAAVSIEGPDPAARFEALFARHGWPPAWRNGVYGYHHFHSNAHEVLGLYSGEVTVQLGGEPGIIVTATAGDVLVLPAGTGHKKLAARGALGVVGGYPAGQHPDLCVPLMASVDARQQPIACVPHPKSDPVHGAKGPLLSLWAPASGELFQEPRAHHAVRKQLS